MRSLRDQRPRTRNGQVTSVRLALTAIAVVALGVLAFLVWGWQLTVVYGLLVSVALILPRVRWTPRRVRVTVAAGVAILAFVFARAFWSLAEVEMEISRETTREKSEKKWRSPPSGTSSCGGFSCRVEMTTVTTRSARDPRGREPGGWPSPPAS